MPAERYLDRIREQGVMNSLKSHFEAAENIHWHTKNIGRLCREIFLAADDELSFSEPYAMPIVETASEIMIYCGGDDDVSRVLQTIIQNQQTIDPETGLNPAVILIRAWALTRNPFIEYPGLQDVIVYNLKHNILAGGGCVAGICARLVHPFSAAVWIALNNIELQSKFDTLRMSV